MNSFVAVKKSTQVYEQFRYLYQQDHLNAAQLSAIYAEDVVFKDPVHTINGLAALVVYFDSLGKNLNTCRFEFVDEIVTPQQAHITWNMRFSHKKIAGGKEQCVRGMSYIRFEGQKICYHEDCYDIGAMVYEQLPFIGKTIQWIKKRMSS